MFNIIFMLQSHLLVLVANKELETRKREKITLTLNRQGIHGGRANGLNHHPRHFRIRHFVTSLHFLNQVIIHWVCEEFNKLQSWTYCFGNFPAPPFNVGDTNATNAHEFLNNIEKGRGWNFSNIWDQDCSLFSTQKFVTSRESRCCLPIYFQVQNSASRVLKVKDNKGTIPFLVYSRSGTSQFLSLSRISALNAWSMATYKVDNKRSLIISFIIYLV